MLRLLQWVYPIPIPCLLQAVMVAAVGAEGVGELEPGTSVINLISILYLEICQRV